MGIVWQVVWAAHMRPLPGQQGPQFEETTWWTAGPFIVLNCIALLMTVMAGCLCQAGLMKVIAGSRRGEEVTVRQAYRSVLLRMQSLLAASVLKVAIVAAGLVFCVVPGVIFGLFTSVVAPAIVGEDLRAFAGIKRSWKLVSWNAHRAFLIWFQAGSRDRLMVVSARRYRHPRGQIRRRDAPLLTRRTVSDTLRSRRDGRGGRLNIR